jgi:chromosomal replication initiation ATPase DnaA
MLRALIAQEAIEIACDAWKISVFELKARQRRRALVSHARQIAMYLAHVVGQLSLSEISAVFERDRTTVGYACHLVEDRRDSPIFDRQIETLEIDMRARMETLFARYAVESPPSSLEIRLARMSLTRA